MTLAGDGQPDVREGKPPEPQLRRVAARAVGAGEFHLGPHPGHHQQAAADAHVLQVEEAVAQADAQAGQGEQREAFGTVRFWYPINRIPCSSAVGVGKHGFFSGGSAKRACSAVVRAAAE